MHGKLKALEALLRMLDESDQNKLRRKPEEEAVVAVLDSKPEEEAEEKEEVKMDLGAEQTPTEEDEDEEDLEALKSLYAQL